MILGLELGFRLRYTQLFTLAKQETIVADPSPIPPASTFILRFWREGSPDQVRWRCRVEHVQSGAGSSCLDLESILDFIQELGVMADNMDKQGEERA